MWAWYTNKTSHIILYDVETDFQRKKMSMNFYIKISYVNLFFSLKKKDAVGILFITVSNKMNRI